MNDLHKIEAYKALTPRCKNIQDREKESQVYALRNYFREYNISQRSSNVDDTNRTLSVLQEHEANEILTFLAKEG